jgi:predicted RND superfamily exporter protein
MRIWHRLSETLAHWIVQRRLVLFGIVAVMIAGGIWVVQSRQNFDSEVLNLLPGDSPAVKALKVVNDQFTQARALTFAIRGEAEMVANFSEHFIEELRKEPWVVRWMAGSPMESEEGLKSLQGVLPALLLNLEEQPFQEALGTLRPEAMEARLKRLKAEVEAGSPKAEIELNTDPLGMMAKALRPLASLSSGQSRNGLESEDGTMRIVPVVTNQPTLSQPDCAALMDTVHDFRRRVVQSWSGPAPEVLVTGRSAYVAEIAASMQRDISVTSTISILAVTALFYFGFRRLFPLIGIIFILTLSCFASFALGSLFFDKLNVIAIAFCSILVGLGDDFSLLLYNRYLRARNDKEDHQKAIATSIREVSKGIIFVALTTGAGFLTLAGSSSRGFSQLGMLIAIGIVLCGAFMIGLLFLFIPKNTTMGTKDRSRAILGPIVAGMKRARAPLGIAALALFALVVGFALAPYKALEFNTNPRSLEPRDSPASIALHAISDKLPSVKEPLMVLIESKNPAEAHARWDVLNKRMQEMVDQGLLASFTSPAGLQFSEPRVRQHQAALKTIHWDDAHAAFLRTVDAEGFNRDAFGSVDSLFAALKGAATAGPELLDLKRVLPESSSWWFLIDRFIASDPKYTVGFLNLPQPLKNSEEIGRFEQPILEADPQARVTGWGYSLLTLVPWARKEAMTFSIGVSGLIALMLALAYRNWRPWLTHILSLIFAISLTVVVLKLTGVQINLLNALAFPLIVGVGVDYGMHILMAAHDTDELATVLKPVVLSGLTTIVGFGALMAARNPALSGMGAVCSVGVASCLVSALLFAIPVLGLFPQPVEKKD